MILDAYRNSTVPFRGVFFPDRRGGHIGGSATTENHMTSRESSRNLGHKLPQFEKFDQQLK